MRLESLHQPLNEDGKVDNAIGKAVSSRGFETQADAAKAAGVANSTLSRYKHLGQQGKKSKKRTPSLRTLAAIAQNLGGETADAILKAAGSEFTKNKTIRQRSKKRHGTRTVSTKAMKQAQEED